MFRDFSANLLALLFPDLCNGCGNALVQGESEICAACMFDLPFTDFHLYRDNPVAKQLWGRMDVKAAMSLLYFKKAGKVQQLIHHLKYRNRTGVGELLGKLIGVRLLESDQYKEIELILPVPLHRKRLQTRGYNQSSFIAKGIAEQLGVSCSDLVLFRDKATETQTKKTRYNRYENMQEVFTVKRPELIKDKHVLLVDDVVTTGATLEGCGLELLKKGAGSLRIATLAFSE